MEKKSPKEQEETINLQISMGYLVTMFFDSPEVLFSFPFPVSFPFDREGLAKAALLSL